MSNYENGDVPWITPADLSGYTEKTIARGARNITRRGLDSSGARLLPAGTVLFSSRAPIGYIAIAPVPVSTNQGFKSFILSKGLLPDFVYYYLKRGKEFAVALASGTTFLEISGAKAALIPIPLAPSAEQRRIVAEIEQQFTRLDAAVAALQRARANLKRYRAAVLKAACEGRLVPTEAELARAEGWKYESGDQLLARILAERRARWEAEQQEKYTKTGKQPPFNWRTKYEEPSAPDTSELSELPEGWSWAHVEHCLSEPLANGRSVPDATEINGGFPVLRLTALKNGAIDLTERKNGAWTEAEAQRFLVRRGDFFVARGNGSLSLVGRGGLVAAEPDLVAYPDTLIRIRVNEALVYPPFFQHLWNSSLLRRQVESSARTTAGIYKISQQDIGTFVLPIPPLSEQHRVANEIERRLSAVGQLEIAVDAGLKRAERLRQAILKHAFEGRLVPQDPNDEPASVLLERIRFEHDGRAQSAAGRRPGRRYGGESEASI